jgi:hypothetical protein
MDTCTNGEVYNLIIRGGDRGGLDGVDVWSTNIWVHDVEVSNRDEWWVLSAKILKCSFTDWLYMNSVTVKVRDEEYPRGKNLVH